MGRDSCRESAWIALMTSPSRARERVSPQMPTAAFGLAEVMATPCAVILTWLRIDSCARLRGQGSPTSRDRLLQSTTRLSAREVEWARIESNVAPPSEYIRRLAAHGYSRPMGSVVKPHQHVRRTCTPPRPLPLAAEPGCDLGVGPPPGPFLPPLSCRTTCQIGDKVENLVLGRPGLGSRKAMSGRA